MARQKIRFVRKIAFSSAKHLRLSQNWFSWSINVDGRYKLDER